MVYKKEGGGKTETGKTLCVVFCSIYPFLLCFCLTIFTLGCGQGGERIGIGSANLLSYSFSTEKEYKATIYKYETLIKNHPQYADRLLFEMGIIHGHPRNVWKCYAKALECYEKIINDYPASMFRKDSQMLVLQIHNVILKDRLISKQQEQIDSFRRGVKDKDQEIKKLQSRVALLKKKVFDLRKEPVDKVLIEKKKRLLTLISDGVAVKSYNIALGGNPLGPKERRGDKKTPEGIYTIEARNRHSDYHLSLRISYPNEQDKARARKLGVSPGGDVMIHGIKNGLSWVGSLHSELDWTQGCIAVTNEEMEEIARLVPTGSIVEIKP